MRMATFNVMHGRSLSDGVVDPDRFGSVIAELDCDVLALQEVDLDQPRSGGLDLCAAAAAALGVGEEGRYFAPTVYGTPGADWRPADGRRAAGEPAYGIALISRLPVRGWRVLPLGRAPVRSPVAVLGPGGRPRLILLDDEPRVAIIAELDAPGGGLTVAATHLSFVPGWNAAQLRRLLRDIDTGPEPAVLLGDLNLPGPLPGVLASALPSGLTDALPTLLPDRLTRALPGRLTGASPGRLTGIQPGASSGTRRGWRRLAVAPTYPVPGARVQLDHILGRGPLPAVVATTTRTTAISDHRALLVDLADPTAG